MREFFRSRLGSISFHIFLLSLGSPLPLIVPPDRRERRFRWQMRCAIVADVWNLTVFQLAPSRDALGKAYTIHSRALDTFLDAFAT